MTRPDRCGRVRLTGCSSPTRSTSSPKEITANTFQKFSKTCAWDYFYSYVKGVAMPTESKRREFTSVRGVCQIGGISPRTVYRLVSAGILKPYRIGPKLIRFDVDEVEQAFTAQC